MLRLAYTLAHRCREHLFHRDQLARLLTLYDHWLVVLGPVGATPLPDDGTHDILRDVARRHPSTVTVLESASGWLREVDAVRAALLSLREQLSERYPEAYLWRVEPWEVWDPVALLAAERELRERDLDCGAFLADFHVGDELLVRGDWGEGRAEPYRRLWRWRGALCGDQDPLQVLTAGLPALLAPRFDSFLYLYPTAHHHPQHVRARYQQLRLRPAQDFPLPLAELLGPTGAGLTDTYLHHHDQADPIPS